jgi:hypothetical protein
MEPGLHRIAPEDYHADNLCVVPTLSSGIARLLLSRSPLHAWHAHPRLNPDYEPIAKATFDIGRVAHEIVLGAGGGFAAYPPELLASNGAVSTTEAKLWAEDMRAEGITPLKAADLDAAGRMADAVLTALRSIKVKIDPTRAELTALADVDGVRCRAMLDYLRGDDLMIDIKTTMNASPAAVVRAVEEYGYDHQAAHYLDTLEAVEGGRRRFLFAFVEKEQPHEVGFAMLHDQPGAESDWMEDARGKAREARRVWAECLAVDQWPGYPRAIATIGARGFFRDRWTNYEGAPRPDPKPTQAATKAWARAQAPEGYA